MWYPVWELFQGSFSLDALHLSGMLAFTLRNLFWLIRIRTGLGSGRTLHIYCGILLGNRSTRGWGIPGRLQVKASTSSLRVCIDLNRQSLWLRFRDSRRTCSSSLLAALRPPSPPPRSSNPASVNFRALRFNISVSTQLSTSPTASPQAGPQAALSSFTLIWFLIHSLTTFMLPGQTDGSRLVLI